METTAKIVVTYNLDSASQRAALAEGHPLPSAQHLSISPPPATSPEAWQRICAAASMRSDGSGEFDLTAGPTGCHRSLPLLRTAEDVLAVLAADVAAVARDQAEREESRRREEEEYRQDARQWFEQGCPTYCREPVPISEILALPAVVALAAAIQAGDPVGSPYSGHDLRAAARNAAEQRRRAVEQERAQEAGRQAQADQEAWIEAHGSARLRRCLAEGIEHGAIYRDERAAADLAALHRDRPGWAWERETPGEGREPRNPSVEALDLLDQARSVDPDAQLRYWVDDDSDPECPAWRGYVASAQYLGREIVLGYGGDGDEPEGEAEDGDE